MNGIVEWREKQPTRNGNCNQCNADGILYLHEGELQFWGYDPAEAAWLCAGDWEAREAAVLSDAPFVRHYPQAATTRE